MATETRIFRAGAAVTRLIREAARARQCDPLAGLSRARAMEPKVTRRLGDFAAARAGVKIAPHHLFGHTLRAARARDGRGE
jgi:hypothetical protein